MVAKVCLVTGASSGIGHATALGLLHAGHTVYGAARRVEKMSAIRAAGGHISPVDVTEEADLQRVVSTVLAEQGRIDVLVNNAGAGLYGAAEDVPIERARDLFEINLFGVARLTQLVLPHMREHGSGTIINVSSIAGVIALPLGCWYHASKHALEAYSDTLRREVGRFGIRVVVVQPGLVKTEFQRETARQLREFSGDGAYQDLAEAMIIQSEKAFGETSKASDPAVVARTITRAVESARPKTRYAVGYLAKPVVLLSKLMPSRAFDALTARSSGRRDSVRP
ncbi:oxidoreductase [Microbispora sp. NPDC049125]|uniref:oxidoreductase n=1 Tax=Microbispora sp. NPDC049125 TaxID=3154929 RepID=UPI003467375E